MKKYKGTGDKDLIKQAQNHLQRLDNLPEQHRQYRRLASLRKKLQDMMS
jgi:hypothetical protein